jgi:hypothetical protein
MLSEFYGFLRDITLNKSFQRSPKANALLAYPAYRAYPVYHVTVESHNFFARPLGFFRPEGLTLFIAQVDRAL